MICTGPSAAKGSRTPTFVFLATGRETVLGQQPQFLPSNEKYSQKAWLQDTASKQGSRDVKLARHDERICLSRNWYTPIYLIIDSQFSPTCSMD
jgi:hypothetical protein